MRTLIFNGSPRRQGDTSFLTERLAEMLPGEVRIIRAYGGDISPCVDCRCCQNRKDCCIQDAMQQVYPYLESCDNILIASPIYFGQLTGPLLGVMSRLQPYFYARYRRGETPFAMDRRGAVLLVGGGAGSGAPAAETASMLLKQMGAGQQLPPVIFQDTDRRPAGEDEGVRRGLEAIAAHFRRER